MACAWPWTVAEDSVKVGVPKDSFWEGRSSKGEGRFLAQEGGGSHSC